MWARKVLQERNPKAEILDPEVGRCCNGWQRGGSQARYDFRLGGRRVKIKTTKMVWVSVRQHWELRFSSVKLGCGGNDGPPFDELYLVIISPARLTLIHHDLVTGVNAQGKSTEVSGHLIRVCGTKKTGCWSDALKQILEKLCEPGGCNVVAEKPLKELGFEKVMSQGTPRGQEAGGGIPMSSMSREKRGNRIQQIGLAIDHRLHPHSELGYTKGNRGNANGPADWVRGTHRVELKSCALTFDRSKNLWQCYFQSIKPDLFDELWLAIYTCLGIQYYRSQSCKRLPFSKAGVRTKIHGHKLAFSGPRGEIDVLDAFKVIESKMISKGLELVAVVEWEKRGSRHVLSACRFFIVGLMELRLMTW